MGYATLLVMATLMDVPSVSVSTLQGEQFDGQLQFLTATEIVLKLDNTEKRIPVDQVLEFHRTENNPAGGESEAIEVQLVDNSLIVCSQITTTQKAATIQSKQLGKFTVDLGQIKAVRFAEADAEGIRDSWRELRSRELKRDLLVIRKADALDYLDGAVGTIDDAQVRFLLDKDLIPVQREKVFGVVYQRDASASVQPRCRLEFQGEAVLFAQSITWAGDKYRVTLTSGTEVEVPPDELTAADFSFGKLRYLSQMEPRDVEYTPFFDITWEYRKNRNLDGQPIRLGDVSYARGLCIHSKTLLHYRIGGDFRRFQAVMGIDESVAQNGFGHVHVVIKGDAKTLLETDVSWKDDPQPLDLDVTGVRDLEILVDFGKDLDISDHLDLADAKVVK